MLGNPSNLDQTFHAYLENPEIKQFLFHQLLSNLQTALQALNPSAHNKPVTKRPLLKGLISYISLNNNEDTDTRENLNALLNKLNNDTTQQDSSPEGCYGDNSETLSKLIQSSNSLENLLTFINQVISLYPIAENTKKALQQAITKTFITLDIAVQTQCNKHQEELTQRERVSPEMLNSANSSRQSSPNSSRPGSPRTIGREKEEEDKEKETQLNERKSQFRDGLITAVMHKVSPINQITYDFSPVDTLTIDRITSIIDSTPLTENQKEASLKKLSFKLLSEKIASMSIPSKNSAWDACHEPIIWRHLLTILYPKTDLTTYIAAINRAIESDENTMTEEDRSALLSCTIQPAEIEKKLEAIKTHATTAQAETSKLIDYRISLIQKAIHQFTQHIKDYNEVQIKHICKKQLKNQLLTAETILTIVNALPTNINKESLLKHLRIEELNNTFITDELQDEAVVWHHLQKIIDGKMTPTQARLTTKALLADPKNLEEYSTYLTQYDFSYHGMRTAIATETASHLSCPANLDLDQTIQKEENELFDYLLDSLSDLDQLFMHHTAGVVATVLDYLASDNEQTQLNTRSLLEAEFLKRPCTIDSIRQLLKGLNLNTIYEKLKEIDNQTNNKALLISLIKLVPLESPYRNQLKRDVFVMAMKLHAEHALNARDEIHAKTTSLLRNKQWFHDFTKIFEKNDFSVNGILSTLEQSSDCEGNLFLSGKPEPGQPSSLTAKDMHYIKECLELEGLKMQKEFRLFCFMQVLAQQNKGDSANDSIDEDNKTGLSPEKTLNAVILACSNITEEDNSLLLALHRSIASTKQTLNSINKRHALSRN